MKRMRLLFLPIVLALFFGGIITFGFQRYGEDVARKHLLKLVTASTAGLNAERVASLAASPSDLETANFAVIRSVLKSIRNNIPESRFVYLMGLEGETVVFLADAESVDSDDYSAPGDLYEEASAELIDSLTNGTPFVEGPFTDAWGEWVSGHAPIRDSESGATLAILGIDIAANDWRSFVAQYRWFGLSMSSLVLLCVVIVVTDALKQRNLNRELQSEMAQRQQYHADLHLAQEKLLIAERVRSLHTMAGSLAHNFNNMLAAALGFCEFVLDDLPRDSEARTNLLQVQEAIERAAGLSRLMLNYVGHIDLDLEEVDLAEWLAQNKEQLNSIITDRVELEISPDGELPKVMVDPEKLLQVITNLVANGVEAIGESLGSVRIETQARFCDSETLAQTYLYEGQQQGDYVILKIMDTGSGMDKKTLGAAFDPYFTTKFTGRGLGLASVFGIVRCHNGAIKMESSKGEGTSVSVFIPTFPIAPEQFSEQVQA